MGQTKVSEYVQRFYLHSDSNQYFGVASFLSENNDLFFIRLKGAKKDRCLTYSLFYCLKHINPMFPAEIYCIENTLEKQLERLLEQKEKMAYSANTPHQDLWAQIFEQGIKKLAHIKLTKHLNKDHIGFMKLKNICEKALASPQS